MKIRTVILALCASALAFALTTDAWAEKTFLNNDSSLRTGKKHIGENESPRPKDRVYYNYQKQKPDTAKHGGAKDTRKKGINIGLELR